MKAALGALVAAMLLPVGIAQAQDLPAAAPLPSIFDFPTIFPEDSHVPYHFSGEASLSQAATYDSNPLLLSKNARAIFGSTTSPELIIRDGTPDALISIGTLVNENVYDRSDYNSTDLHETVDLGWRKDQWYAALQTKYDEDTTRTSELSNFNIDLPSVHHTDYSASPEIAYNITSADRVSITGVALRSSYNSIDFTDYDLYTLNPSYAHQFNPTNAGTLTLNGDRYQAMGGSHAVVDTIGPSVGWTTLITPRMSAEIDGGFQESNQDSTATSPSFSNFNYTFKADVTYRSQVDKFDLIATRAQEPFGNGTESLVTALGVTEAHTLTDKVAVNAAINYETASATAGADAVSSINLKSELSGSAGVSYHLLEHLDLDATYQYRNEHLTNTSGTITDNSVLLSIVYRPPVKKL